ncbi:unnamed protein product [Musa acuminata subsp. malaccensis]|uniref:(wild Malaysian banana) hypothetical protein n=1 Tax=Musa acuminata subsp. malaccensis TaxID=214687 RepID=A0A804L7B5_MUSAM|nr:unnamed protein product [Musa acuminata subsp. malaccensis]
MTLATNLLPNVSMKSVSMKSMINSSKCLNFFPQNTSVQALRTTQQLRNILPHRNYNIKKQTKILTLSLM